MPEITLQSIETKIPPKYKVQFFQAHTLSWRDIQKTYDSLPEAKAQAGIGANTRIMVIQGKKRYVLEENAPVV